MPPPPCECNHKCDPSAKVGLLPHLHCVYPEPPFRYLINTDHLHPPSMKQQERKSFCAGALFCILKAALSNNLIHKNYYSHTSPTFSIILSSHLNRCPLSFSHFTGSSQWQIRRSGNQCWRKSKYQGMLSPRQPRQGQLSQTPIPAGRFLAICEDAHEADIPLIGRVGSGVAA